MGTTLVLSSLPAFAAEVRTAITTLSTGETITSKDAGSACQQAKILEDCGKRFTMGSPYFQSCALDAGTLDSIAFAQLAAAIEREEGGAEAYEQFIQDIRAQYPDCFQFNPESKE
ncbi:hypothetical protein K9M43_02965 [Candidatus Gracilibacteria bacterium]|nr:hypothetical protein [Candidatus Gracilibacteria bacterium]MCF7896899.1 hypothetical protein [Candidatus Gracilibacteria bacterium]